LGPEYREHLEGLVFGDDPRSGFFEASRFYHPGLEFQIILPTGWTYQNTPSALLAASEQFSASMQITLGTVRDSSTTPAEYVDSLTSHHAIVGAAGRPESFRDYAAWVGTVAMPSEGGATEIPAGFVRIKPGQFLEIIGQAKSQQGGDQIYQSIRSVAALRDSAKLNVGPDILSIAQAKRTGTFSEIWSDFGHLALSVEDGAILNGTRGNATIQAGTPIKIVRKGFPGQTP
ncbi:MAG: hypothetical protein ACRENN_06900, partial [Candidatus Eiseniibacteriota bacterium]